MDPLTHTLVGASLSETPLRRLSRLAAPTLILAANAPDIDVMTMALGQDLSLGLRRGWTHGVLAMALLPLALTAVVVATDRVVARLKPGRIPAPVRPVLALSYVGVLTHPLLDWLNTYGIRFLMPFDGRWFYGDALYIIDPWIWLLTSTAVLLARSRTRLGQTAWLVLGVVLTSLVTGVAAVPSAARLIWIGGVGVVVALRISGTPQSRIPKLATLCLTAAAVYIAMMIVGSRIAARQVETWLAARGDTGIVVMAGPIPANPFVRDVVVRDDSHYHFIELNWLRSEPIRVVGTPIERGRRDAIVEAALTTPIVQGVRTWMRFPAYHVETLADGYLVTIRDVRYTRRDQRPFDPRTQEGFSLGTAVVELDRDLRVRVTTSPLY